MASCGPVKLSFHDSLLRESDVNTLQDGEWLNDNIISFMFEYYRQETFKSYSDKIAFIGPEVTQFIKLGSEYETSLFLEPLCLSSKELIVFAVNDNSSAKETGGSHWSCLVCNRLTQEYQHLDSSSSHNSQSAKTVCKALNKFLTGQKQFSFVNTTCPQQTNCCDCGLYALCFAESSVWKHIDGRETLKKITPYHVKQKRKDILTLIQTLAS